MRSRTRRRPRWATGIAAGLCALPALAQPPGQPPLYDPLGLGLGTTEALPRTGGGAVVRPDGSLELDCLIEPEKRIVLAAPVIGVVDEVLVKRGDRVEQGQTVAVLERTLELANLELARARAESDAELRGSRARHDFEVRRVARNESLHDRGVVSDLQLDEIRSASILAESNLLQAEDNRNLAALELRRAEAALEMRSVKSPIDGVVVDVIVHPGEYADPPQLIELAQIDPLRVEVFAPMSALGKVEVGARATVLPENPDGAESTAEIVVVDRVVDAASGTFGVRLALPNPDLSLSAGLKCRVRIPPPAGGAFE